MKRWFGSKKSRQLANQPRRLKLINQTPRSQLNSYYRSKPGNISQKNNSSGKRSSKKSYQKVLSRLVDWAIVGVVFFCLVYSLSIKPTPKLAVNSQAYHSKATYQTSTVNQFKAWRNRTKITFSESALTSKLIKQFPEISSVEVELPLFGQIALVRINVDEPAVILSSNKNDFVVSNTGRAIVPKASLPNINNLIMVDDQTDFTLKAGEQVMSMDEVHFIKTLVAQCQKASIPIKSLVLPSLAKELHLRTSDRRYFVKFFLGGDPVVQAGQFIAARNQLSVDKAQPSEYLDVRAEGKAFYK